MTTDEVLAISLGNVRAIRDWTNEKVDRIYEDGFASKNIFNDTVPTQTKNGVTLTNNGDGTFTLNGRATGNITFYSTAWGVTTFKHGKYRLTGCPKGGSRGTYYVDAYDGDSTTYERYVDEGNGVNINSNITVIRIGIQADTVANNIIFKPMLVDASIYPNTTYDDFEPYAKSNVELTSILERNVATLTVPSGATYTANIHDAIKFGFVCQIRYLITGYVGKGDYDTLGTLPTDFRPNAEVLKCVDVSGNASGYLRIKSNGEIQINIPNNTNTSIYLNELFMI